MLQNNSKNVKKIDIYKKIYSEIGISKTYIKEITEDLIEILSNLLISDKKIILKNLGSFKIVNKKERIGRNPINKMEYKITKRKSISFKVSQNLKNKINND